MTEEAVRPGRPPKISDELTLAITNNVRMGAPLHIAARAAGIGYSTFKRWMAEGADPEGRDEYKAFRATIEEARAQTAVRMVGLVSRAAANSVREWRAAMTWLERAYPEDFGPKQTHEITGAGGGPVAVMSHTDVARLREALLERSESIETTARELPAGGEDDDG